jgi:hypothetical protein
VKTLFERVDRRRHSEDEIHGLQEVGSTDGSGRGSGAVPSGEGELVPWPVVGDTHVDESCCVPGSRQAVMGGVGLDGGFHFLLTPNQP